VLVRTDDEVYRVDSVWLGPPRATFPWRARYVSYGVGLLVMILVMFLQRRVGIGLSFFSVAWGLIITVVVTRLLGKRIDYERPLGQVFALFSHEVTGPRARTGPRGGPVRAGHVRIRSAVERGLGRNRTAPSREWSGRSAKGAPPPSGTRSSGSVEKAPRSAGATSGKDRARGRP
jgi:hypothetical protein